MKNNTEIEDIPEFLMRKNWTKEQIEQNNEEWDKLLKTQPSESKKYKKWYE